MRALLRTAGRRLAGYPPFNLDLPRPRGTPPEAGRPFPGRLVLGLVLGGLLSSLFILAGARLIEPVVNPACRAFPVGSPDTALTHFRIENSGAQATTVRIYFIDGMGPGSAAEPFVLGMQGRTSSNLALKDMPMGSVALVSSADERVLAGLVVDDGSDAARGADLCLVREVMESHVTPAP